MTDLEKKVIRDALINQEVVVKEQLCANEVPLEKIDQHLDYLDTIKRLIKKYSA